jgi:hypothetical protein
VAAEVELAVLVAIVVLVVGFAFVRHGGGGSRRINESYDLVGELSLLWPNVRSLLWAMYDNYVVVKNVVEESSRLFLVIRVKYQLL